MLSITKLSRTALNSQSIFKHSSQILRRDHFDAFGDFELEESVRQFPVGLAVGEGEGGAVAKVLGQYEDRPSQRDMAAYVADSYNDGGVSLLAAGTGVGKSFAYLVSAIEWSLANGERTVVSPLSMS